MKSRLLLRSFKLVCSCLLLSVASAFAFEGKVEMTMSTSKKDETMPMTYYVKGSKMRMEIAIPPDKKKKGNDGGSMAMIYDLPARQMIILMPQQNMYMVHQLPEPSQTPQPQATAGGPPPAGNSDHSGMQFKPTGRKEKIAGLDAEEYVGVSENKRTEIWVTKGLGKFIMANQGPGGSPFGGGGRGGAAATPKGWEAFAQQGEFFPLRVIQRDKEGSPENFRMETTNIDRTPPADAMFAPPPGYQKFEMPNIGDAMRGMIPH